MLRKVKIKSLPKAKNGGVSYNQLAPMYMPNNMNLKPVKVKDTLQPVPREQANLEAEKNETALITDANGLPAHFKIGGKRHSEGGTPLNLPEDTFIFSDTKAMKIKDPEILKEFGMPIKKGGYTPAQIAKKYDINKSREVLADPDADKTTKDTAEKMIANYNLKLGKLALYQESKKGFPGGIPTVSLPYVGKTGMNPQDILPLKGAQTPQEEMDENEMYAEQNPTEEQFEQEETMPQAQFGGGRLGRRIAGLLNGNRQFNPSTGIYMQTDRNGNVMYTDGNGVPMPQNIKLPSEFITPGTRVGNTTTTKTTTTKKVDKKIPEGAIVIKRSDYKTDAEYKTARDKAFKDPKNKGNVYTVDASGKSYKVSSKAFQTPEYKGTDADKVFKGNKDVAGKYQYIEDQLNNNPELQKKLYDETVKELKNPNSQRAKALTARGVDVNKMIDELTPETVTKQFLDMQKRNIALGVHHGKVAGTANAPKSGTAVSNEELEKAANEAGVSMPSAADAALQQAAYRAMNNLAESGQAEGFVPGQVGAADEPGKNKKISPIDAIYTNTTSGQIIGVPGQDTVGEDDLGQEDVAEDISTNELETPATQEQDPEFWLQDVIGTAGAFGDLSRIKKYTPWAPKLAPYIPEPTFYDPTRELGNITEQMAIGTEGAGAFAPAQAYNARMSQMQGQGAKAAADVLGRYNNLNVGASNQFELTKANIFNQTGMANAEAAKNLYDSNVIANQQFDNAKNQARQQLRQSYINAITNRAKAQTLNSVYGDNYMVDPSTGGYTTFTGGDELVADPYATSDADIERFKQLRSVMPGVEDETIWNMATQNAAGKARRNNSAADAYMNAYGYNGAPQYSQNE
jgi:hypothetical protein